MQSARATAALLAIALTTIVTDSALRGEDEVRPVDGAAVAWEALAGLRSRLTTDSPLAADFSQTFTPTGFSSGDTETGVLALRLPDCARWDYAEPFPKSFLLCAEIAHAWNPGEGSGRRYRVSEDEQQGLDLLRLDVEELRQQYDASGLASPDSYRVRLEPRDLDSLLAEATLTIALDRSRLIAIEFSDREGNRTLFEIGNSRPLDSAETFTPPADIDWIED